jgi:hypothetical protein
MNDTDRVLLTVPQIAAQFRVSLGAVRAWIAAGRLEPVLRGGRGPGGTMRFSRGQVAGLLEGRCLLCGARFRRGTLRAKFCSKACRQKSSRLSAKRQEPPGRAGAT